jgi:hypothetical protein
MTLTLVLEFELRPAPARSVFLKSQDLRLVFEQVVDGIEPLRAGLEVRDKVERDAGREFGGEAKLLFVIYLMISHRFLKKERGLTVYRGM